MSATTQATEQAAAAIEDEIAAQMSPEDEQPEPEPSGDELEPDESDESDEPDEPEPDEPEANAPRPGPQSEKEIEKANQALDAEKLRHAKRVSAIMGEDALTLVPCEACAPNIPGFHWPATDFDPGTPQRALYELLSGGADILPVQPDFLVTCTSCNGRGTWKTGSNHPDPAMHVITCTNCDGKGYRDTRERRNEQAATVDAPPALAVVPTVTDEPEQESDMLGRPYGHPNYGKLPIYLTAAEQELDKRDGYSVT